MLSEKKCLGKCSFAPSDARAESSWEMEGMEQVQRRMIRPVHLTGLCLLYLAIPNNRMLQEYLRGLVEWDQMRHPSCFLYLLLSSQPGQFAGLDEVPACPRRKQHSPPSCAGDGVTSVCLLSWSPAGSDTSQHCFSAAVIPQKHIAELGLLTSS